MLNCLIELIIEEDPDILVGFEIDNKSWGYVSRRFDSISHNSNYSFTSLIGKFSPKFRNNSNIDPWIARSSSKFQVPGRITFNLWRIYRDEVALRSYSINELYKHYFHVNAPNLSSEYLVGLSSTDSSAFLRYIIKILSCICDLTVKTPLLVKSIEFSRLFGIDLFSTLTRGSQYRVESILITAAHSENYLLQTPTETDVRQMRAAQGLPLTMEPVSNYYRDPIIVLDFQSLYPSMVIAYNFCYSTIIGTVKKEVVTSDHSIFSAPGDINFIKREEKYGLIPRLLNEILSTRIAIKDAMKSCDAVNDIIIII